MYLQKRENQTFKCISPLLGDTAVSKSNKLEIFGFRSQARHEKEENTTKFTDIWSISVI